MPVVWDAEANAKLVAAVMKVCEVKVGAKQMAEIAALIHPDCTAKAVSHRVAKLRDMAAGLDGGKKSASNSPAKEKRDGGGGKKRAAKKMKGAEDEDEEEDDEEEEEEVRKKVKVEVKADEDGMQGGYGADGRDAAAGDFD